MSESSFEDCEISESESQNPDINDCFARFRPTKQQNRENKKIYALKLILGDQLQADQDRKKREANRTRVSIQHKQLHKQKQAAERQRSRQNKKRVKPSVTIEKKDLKNLNFIELSDNQQEDQKRKSQDCDKFLDNLGFQIDVPIEQLKRQAQEHKLRRKQQQKRERLFQKLQKQYREGKKKDRISNQVFNAIEEYFI